MDELLGFIEVMMAEFHVARHSNNDVAQVLQNFSFYFIVYERIENGIIRVSILFFRLPLGFIIFHSAGVP
jgi:hypothetical protein